MSALTKVLFICLDAAERDLLLEWADAGILPNMQALRQRSRWGDAPALPGLGSGALWPSFSTGVNPSRHGHYFTLQMREGTYKLYKYRFDIEHWRPFWSTLSQAGRRVAVINVPYDALCNDINGLHIVDWGIHNPQRSEAGIWPPEEAKEVAERFGTEDPFGICDHYNSDGADMEVFSKRLLARIAKKGDLACHYLDQGGWDLFLMTFDESHCAGHRAWHLHDPDYPHHDPEIARKVGDPVKDMYVAIDAQIGRLLECVGPETTVILLSGTGMGPNFTGNHLLDEILSRLEDNRPGPGQIVSKTARLIWSKILPPHIRARLRSKVVHVEQSLTASDRKRRKAFTVPHNDFSGAIRINLVGREPNGRIHPGPVFDSMGNLIIGDEHNHAIRVVGLDGRISTMVGNGKAGYAADGTSPAEAILNDPEYVLARRDGSLLNSDGRNGRLLEVTPDGLIWTFAGRGKIEPPESHLVFSRTVQIAWRRRETKTRGVNWIDDH